MFCIASLVLANVLARDLDIPPSTVFPEHRVLETCSPQLPAQFLKSKENCLSLVVRILLSLVALGFTVMLHGGGWRKMFAASRISLWDPISKKSLVVAHKQLLPSSMPEVHRAWKRKAKMKPLLCMLHIGASGLILVPVRMSCWRSCGHRVAVCLLHTQTCSPPF